MSVFAVCSDVDASIIGHHTLSWPDSWRLNKVDSTSSQH